MVVDYSKWDKLELSDDSDIEGKYHLMYTLPSTTLFSLFPSTIFC